MRRYQHTNWDQLPRRDCVEQHWPVEVETVWGLAFETASQLDLLAASNQRPHGLICCITDSEGGVGVDQGSEMRQVNWRYRSYESVPDCD